MTSDKASRSSGKSAAEKLSASEWKQRGNDQFDQRRFRDALHSYSNAIEQAAKNTPSSYYTNRALCYIRLGKWDACLRDAASAFQLDPHLIKAHYYSGIALMEKGCFEDSLNALVKANELARSSSHARQQTHGDEISAMIRQCRKRRWNRIEEKRMEEEVQLQRYLDDLVSAECERQKLRGALAASSSSDAAAQANDIEHQHQVKREQLARVFAQVDERRRRRDVPDYLCGKIGFELMRDPVITPSGITYERRDIEEHLRRVGHFDPITRHDLDASLLTPNLAMKEVVDSFLCENEWAVDY